MVYDTEDNNTEKIDIVQQSKDDILAPSPRYFGVVSGLRIKFCSLDDEEELSSLSVFVKAKIRLSWRRVSCIATCSPFCVVLSVSRRVLALEKHATKGC
jgi:hypothetical protein